MLIGCAFCRLLAVSRLLHWKFCWFWHFLCDFHFLDYQGHPKSPHRRLEIKEVSERAVLTYPDQLAIHILKPTTTGEDLGITRLTCNSGVNFGNRYDCWSQWPIQCIRLWSQFLLAWIWISLKCIHHRMSVSNRWVLSLKIQFLLSICVSRTSIRPSSHFHLVFRLLKRRKTSE